MVDVEKEKTKGEEVHEEIQRIRYETFSSYTDNMLLMQSFAKKTCIIINPNMS